MTTRRGGRRDFVVLVGSIIAAFVLTRGLLWLRPNADAFVAGYNVHHLFSGALGGIACAFPLLLSSPTGWRRDALLLGFGASTSLVLDEVVYLIATDGSNASYFTSVSWVGAIVLICAACAYAAALSVFRRER
jgi:hypothetical protein